MQLTVTDATGLSSAPAVVTLATSSCGLSRPTISSAGASTTTPDPGRPVTLFAQPDDVDNGGSCLLGQALSVRWTISSRPAGSGAALSDPLSTHPVFTPDKVGSYQFQVVAFDSTGRSSDPTWVTLTTTRCGTAVPSVTASPASLSILPLQSVQLLATPLDANTSCGLTETFHYSWQLVSSPRGSNGLLTNATSPNATFRPDLAGSYLLQVTATDAEGHVSAPSFSQLTVSSCATLGPLVSSISGSAATLGTPVTLAASGAVSRNCVAAGPLTYSWQLAGKPLASHALLDDPMAASPKFTPDVAGAYQVKLVVKDSAGLASLPAWTTVVVAPCGSSSITWNAVPITKSFQEPDGSAGTQANAGTRVTLGAQFTDVPSACSLAVAPFQVRWAIVSRPAGSSAQLTSSTAASPAFVADVPGSYQLAVQVTDALGTVSATRFDTVTTSACGTSLPVVAIAAASTTLNTFASQALSVTGGTATDPDDVAANCPVRFRSGGFTYQWSLTRTAGGALGTTAGVSTNFTASAAGVSTVQLIATAANGLRSLPAVVDLTAAPCGSHAPQVLAVQTLVTGQVDARPKVGDAVRLTANVVDADNVAGCTDSVAQYQWRVLSLPSGSAVAAPAPGSSQVIY